MNLTKVSSLLKVQFGFHLSRIHCLVSFVFGLIQAKSVNLHLIAQQVANSKPSSAYKRLQRFVQQVSFSQETLASLIVSILELDRRAPWKLVFDRTNWKIGSKHVNILFLAVCGKGLSIPLFYKLLDGKKSGNSDQEDRILLLEKFIKTFGKKCGGVLLGDREFIGRDWFHYLNKAGFPYCIRLKEAWQKVCTEGGRSIELKKCFSKITREEVRSLGKCTLGEGDAAVNCFITGMISEDGEWVVVAHSEGLENPCELYRARWQIERMFLAMKTGGFHLEDTHLYKSERLECLLGVLCIAYAICYKTGILVVTETPPKPKKHGYWPKSVFRYGLDQLLHTMAQIFSKFALFSTLLSKIFAHVIPSKKSFVL